MGRIHSSPFSPGYLQPCRLPLTSQRETRGLPSPCSDESGALDLGTSVFCHAFDNRLVLAQHV